MGASLGHASWAVLLYPLEVVRVGENGWRRFAFASTQGTATTFFEHVTDPRLWQVVPFRSEVDERRGVILGQTANPEPLLQASLRHCQCLGHDLLASVVAVPCSYTGMLLRPSLLSLVATQGLVYGHEP